MAIDRYTSSRLIFGAALLGLAGAMSLGTVAFGTIPSKVLVGMGRLRFLSGLLLTLAVNFNAEATPAGDWRVTLFERADDEHGFGNSLLHSAYDDPRVVERLIRWVADLTGLPAKLPAG